MQGAGRIQDKGVETRDTKNKGGGGGGRRCTLQEQCEMWGWGGGGRLLSEEGEIHVPY